VKGKKATEGGNTAKVFGALRAKGKGVSSYDAPEQHDPVRHRSMKRYHPSAPIHSEVASTHLHKANDPVRHKKGCIISYSTTD
jgi:hypothetical protein